ncbi:hypothetical protein QJS66_02070 [Kocuria rhizophila]|nr:hypothetical protein QJS66_02070 [Kocuria rhizophila]
MLAGDILGSWRCGSDRLQARLALKRLRRHGGTVLYLRHRGPRRRPGQQLRAYKLQDAGASTVDADAVLGLPAEARDSPAAARYAAPP